MSANLTSLLLTCMTVIIPTMTKNIYCKLILRHPINLEINFSFKWLLILVVALNGTTTIISMGFLKNVPPIPIIIVGIIGLGISLILVFSWYFIFGVSCSALISMCNIQQTLQPNEQSLRSLISQYNKLSIAVQPYLFLTYSCSVCAIIVNMYTVAMVMTGCSGIYVESTFCIKK